MRSRPRKTVRGGAVAASRSDARGTTRWLAGAHCRRTPTGAKRKDDGAIARRLTQANETKTGHSVRRERIGSMAASPAAYASGYGQRS